MSALANEFSWSHARHESFQTCLKRYYFAYYAAWGGWEETAPARARELYRLKRLATRQQWAGHHAHQAIEFLLKNARRDPSGEIAAAAEPRQIEQMRREFRDSRAGAYRADPVRVPGLFEHEYRLEVPAELLWVHEYSAELFRPRPKSGPDDLFAGDLAAATAVVPMELKKPIPVNVNTAGRDLLMGVTGLQQEAAVRAVLTLRQVQPFESLSMMFILRRRLILTSCGRLLITSSISGSRSASTAA